MRGRRRLLLGLVGLLASLLPLGAAATPLRVYYRLASGAWQPLACQQGADGVLRFTVDPAQVGNSSTVLVLNPPAGVALNDSEPPRVIGLKLDGVPYPIAHWPLDLDWLAKPPTNLRLALNDRQNLLDPRTLRLSLDGRAVPDPLRFTAIGVESQTRPGVTWLDVNLSLLLQAPEPLTHTLALSLADRSPQQNRAEVSLRYSCLCRPVEESPLVLTDSAYQGYEDLRVLTDGKVMTPGATTYGVTWASAEEAGNHWVVFAWPAPRALNTITISWASFAGNYWGPRRLLVQTWEKDRWVTRETVTGSLDQPTTTVELGGAQTERLRLLQPDGQGNPARPNLMWVTEIAVR